MQFASIRLVTNDIDRLVAFYTLVTGAEARRQAPAFAEFRLEGATLAISQLMTVMYVAQLVSVMLAIQIVIRTGPVLAYRLAASLFGGALLLYLVFYVMRPAGFADGFKQLP